MGVWRAPENPIIRPEDVKPLREDFEVIGVFNAGVARYHDEVVLLLRVAERPIDNRKEAVFCPIYDPATDEIILRPFAWDDPRNDFSDPRLIVTRTPIPGNQGPAARAAIETYLTSISHLRLARSRDGIRFEIADAPALQAANRYETFGIEDPRVTQIDGTYYIAYVGVSPAGVTTCLASTRDFQSFERHGVIFHPDNKDVALLPERIGGRYYALHRPHSSLFLRNDIWVAESPDLVCWGNHRHLIGTRDGFWDETRIGASAVPFRIGEGWLEVYHGANRSHRYCLGAVLLDAERPWEVLARSENPLFEPDADYERAGFFGGVVFSCGLLFEDRTLKVYYGAADTSICYAEIPLADARANLGL
jgi:beta-1,2-mannobiose phosphorylase / 1,2-beta-oligomannan phosphorylase